jgi:NAD-dependent dihydropyrimidine dehydrogenase PreA subunit
MAEYYAEVMGISPYLTVEQILEKLDRLDTSPIYHMGPNKRDIDFICNCCACCCGVAWPVRKYKGDEHLKDLLLAPSRFLCTIDRESCTGCEICVSKCPFHAIEMQNGTAYIDSNKCFGCGACVINCPDESLKLKLVRPPEHIPEQGTSIVDLMILERVDQ